MAKTTNVDLPELSDWDAAFAALDKEPAVLALNQDVLSNKRKPVLRATKGAISGAKDILTDPRFAVNIVKHALPPEYGYISSSIRAATYDLKELHDHTINEVKPRIAGITRSIEKLVPEERKSLKTLLGKVRKKFEPEESSYRSEDSSDQEVRAMLEGVFGQQAELHAVTNARTEVSEALAIKRHHDLQGIWQDSNEQLARLVGYNDRVNMAYQRRSLELQLRSYQLQTETFSLLKQDSEIARDQLAALVKNTALPDFVKMHSKEHFAELGRTNLFHKIQGRLFGGMQMGEAAKRIKKLAREKLAGALFGADMVAMTLESAAMAKELGGGVDKAELAGQLVGQNAIGVGLGGYLSGKLRKRLNPGTVSAPEPVPQTRIGKLKAEAERRVAKWAKPVGKKLENLSGPLQRVGYIGAKHAGNIPGAIESLEDSALIREADESKGWRGRIGRTARSGLRAYRAIFPTEGDVVMSDTEAGLGSDQPAIFDQPVRRSIVTVIPGLLSAILREAQILRTGNSKIGLTMFDPVKGRFTSKRELTGQLGGLLRSNLKGQDFNSGVNRITEGFTTEGGLSKDDSAALRSIVARTASGSGRKDSNALLHASHYEGMNPQQAARLQAAIKTTVGHGQQQFHRKDFELSQQLGELQRRPEEFLLLAQSLEKAGYGEILDELGLRSSNTAGQQVINLADYQRFLEQPNAISDKRPRAKRAKLPKKIKVKPPTAERASEKAPKFANSDWYSAESPEPVVTAIGLERGDYHDATTGKIIHSAQEVLGPLVNSYGQMVLTKAELARGLLDNQGRKIKFKRWKGRAKSWKPTGIRPPRWPKKMFEAGILSGGSPISSGILPANLGIPTSISGVFPFEGNELFQNGLAVGGSLLRRGADRVKDIAGAVKAPGSLKSRLGAGLRTWWKGKTPSETPPEGTPSETPAASTPADKLGPLSAIAKQLKTAVTAMTQRTNAVGLGDKLSEARSKVVGGFRQRLDEMRARKEALDQTRYRAEANTNPRYRSAGNIFDNLLGKVSGAFGTLFDGLQGIADFFGAGDTFGSLGKRVTSLGGAGSRLGRIAGALRHFGGKLTSPITEILSKVFQAGGSFIAEHLGGVADRLATVGRVGGALRQGALSAGRGAMNVAEAGMRGLGRVLSPVANAARTVGTPLVETLGKVKNVKTVATLLRGVNIARTGVMAAGLLSGGTGAMVAGALEAGLMAIGGILSSPLLLGGAAIAGGVYGAYKLYKYVTRNKVSNLTLVRVRQYGFSHDMREEYHRLLSLEAYLVEEAVGYQLGNPYFIEQKLDIKELLAHFDIDPKDDAMVRRFMGWFQNRFKPVLFTHLKALYQVNNKKQLPDVDDLSDAEKQRYLNLAAYEQGPYQETLSPLKAYDQLFAGPIDVARALQIARKGLKEEAYTPPRLEADTKRPVIPPPLPATDQRQAPTETAAPALPDRYQKLLKDKTAGAASPPVNETTPASPQPATGGVRDFAKGVWGGITGKASNEPEASGKAGGGNFKVVGTAAARGINRVDPRLVQLARVAADSTPYNVELFSGIRPGDTRFHGRGMAIDVRLRDPNTGKEIPNYQNEAGFRPYEKFAQHMHEAQKRFFPELSQALRWGGYFGGPKGKYGALDTMHFDIGGNASLGMGGGSWESGLTESMRKLWPGAKSVGLSKTARASQDALQKTEQLAERVESEPEAMSGNVQVAGVRPNLQFGSGAGPKGDAGVRPNLQFGSGAGPVPLAKPGFRGFTIPKGDAGVRPNLQFGSGAGPKGDAGVRPNLQFGSGAGPVPLAKPGFRGFTIPKGDAGGNSQLPTPSGGGEGKTPAVRQSVAVINAAAQKTGVDADSMKGVAAIESGYNPSAGAKTSSAKGLFQFIGSTWRSMLGKYGRKYGLDPGTSPMDPMANALMAGEYFKYLTPKLQNVKSDLNATDLYLGHFLGEGGGPAFLRGLKENPNASAAGKLAAAAKANQGIFFSRGKPRSYAEVYRLLSERIKTRAGQFGVSIALGDTSGVKAATEQAIPESYDGLRSEPAQDQPNQAAAPAKDQPNQAAAPAQDQPNQAAAPAKDQPNQAAAPAQDQPNQAAAPSPMQKRSMSPNYAGLGMSPLNVQPTLNDNFPPSLPEPTVPATATPPGSKTESTPDTFLQKTAEGVSSTLTESNLTLKEIANLLTQAVAVLSKVADGPAPGTQPVAKAPEGGRSAVKSAVPPVRPTARSAQALPDPVVPVERRGV